MAEKFVRVALVGLTALGLGACANADAEVDAGPGVTIDSAAPPPDIDSGVLDGPDAGGGGGSAQCPPGEVATAVRTDGTLTCAPFDDAVRTAVNTHCSLFFGWRDSCDGCTDPPAKWGRVDHGSCDNGAGADNTCTTPTLDADVVQLFGLNTDGDVNDDDKFYVGLHCTEAVNTGTIVPCKPGEFLARVEGVPVCRTAAVGIVNYVQDNCSVYLGWRDSCDGCTDPPAKWGFANQGGCQVGAGTDNTCSTPDLGGVAVNAIGVNTDGDVDGNDKLYLGIACGAPAAEATPVAGTCPDDSLVTGIAADGSAECTPVGAIAAIAVRRDCYTYFGFRDSCDGCTTIPAKWGRTSHNTCELGVGADDTCTSATLGATEVRLIGVNTDGDVNGDDKFYAGFGCF